LVLIRCRLTIAGRGLVLGRQKVGGQAVELAIAFVAKQSREAGACRALLRRQSNRAVRGFSMMEAIVRERRPFRALRDRPLLRGQLVTS
jgi:hypothetical protein